MLTRGLADLMHVSFYYDTLIGLGALGAIETTLRSFGAGDVSQYNTLLFYCSIMIV